MLPNKHATMQRVRRDCREAACGFPYLFLLALLGAFATSATAEPIARLTTHRAAECPTPCPRTAVIFIHGITGSKETWGSSAGNLYWPAMLASDAALANDVDIYQIDYDSTMFQGPPAVAIETDLEKFLDKLILERKYSKVIFIAHSLGGIFTRTYLLHVKHTYGHAALSRFRMVITLGTPNKGSSLANLGRLLTDNEQIRVLRPIDVNDFQQLVNKSIREIQEKHDGGPSLRTFAAFEKKPVSLLGIVVARKRARPRTHLPRLASNGITWSCRSPYRRTIRSMPGRRASLGTVSATMSMHVRCLSGTRAAPVGISARDRSECATAA